VENNIKLVVVVVVVVVVKESLIQVETQIQLKIVECLVGLLQSR
jgi:hypothetical protein